jgi:transposase
LDQKLRILSYDFRLIVQEKIMDRKKETTAESVVRPIKRKTRKKYGAEEKIRIVLEGLGGDSSIADICRREGIHTTQYYRWSKAFFRIR